MPEEQKAETKELEPQKSASAVTDDSARERSTSVSLTTDDEVTGTLANLPLCWCAHSPSGRQEEKDRPSLQMTVGDYTKHGEGMGSFVSYKINVKVHSRTRKAVRMPDPHV